MKMERTTVVLSKDDYRDFTNNAATLQEQGYDFHMKYNTWKMRSLRSQYLVTMTGTR